MSATIIHSEEFPDGSVTQIVLVKGLGMRHAADEIVKLGNYLVSEHVFHERTLAAHPTDIQPPKPWPQPE